MMGDFARGLEMANRGLAMAEAHLPTQAACYTYRAGTRFPRGEWAEAMDDVRCSLELAERIGDHFRVYMSTGFLGGFLVMSGDQHAGIAKLERAFDAAEKLGTKLAMSVFKAYLAEGYLALRRVDEAIRESQQALELATMTSERWSEAWARRLLASALCAAVPPDTATAQRELLRAMTVEEEIGALPNLARSRLVYGRLLLAMDQPDAGRQAIDSALHMFEHMDMRWDLRHALTTPAFPPCHS
jgi:tetratricopeptide (TPR) repeat protein